MIWKNIFSGDYLELVAVHGLAVAFYLDIV